MDNLLSWASLCAFLVWAEGKFGLGLILGRRCGLGGLSESESLGSATGFFRRSRVAGHRSHQNQKAINNTGNVIITRDFQEVYRYFHVTNVSLYNFNEKFLGVVYVVIGLKYSFQTCRVTHILSL